MLRRTWEHNWNKHEEPGDKHHTTFIFLLCGPLNISDMTHRNMKTCRLRTETRWCGLVLARPPRGGPSLCRRCSRQTDHHRAWLTASSSHVRSAAADVHVILLQAHIKHVKLLTSTPTFPPSLPTGSCRTWRCLRSYNNDTVCSVTGQVSRYEKSIFLYSLAT